MQSPDTTDAPLVPHITTDADADAESESTAMPLSDGGRRSGRAFDRPPETDYAAAYTRDEEEIEPFVSDLR